MKYFTRDIWAGWQSDNEDVVHRAEQKWERNLALYRQQLAALTLRLGLGGKFFAEHSLHDGRLLSFQINDYPLSNLSSKAPRSPRSESSILISVLAWNGSNTPYIYMLRYRGIVDVQIKIRNNLFSAQSSSFDNWGYDELLPKGNDAFRHNILFSTGTEVSVVFKRFTFRRWRKSISKIRQIVTF